MVLPGVTRRQPGRGLSRKWLLRSPWLCCQGRRGWRGRNGAPAYLTDHNDQMSTSARRPQVPPNCDLTLGMVCLDKSRSDRTIWQMRADERFANPMGILQGGFLAAFADSAMGATAITWARDRPATATSPQVGSANAEMKISFLSAARVGSILTCEAQILSGGRRVAFAEAEIHDDAGRLVAKASSTYIILPRSQAT